MGDADVLVVGAGPTGLTLACCLARHGINVRVLERRHGLPSPDRGARGTAYQVRTLEVFDDLGVIDEALDGTWTDMPTRIYRDGQLISDLSVVAERILPSPELPYPTMARPLPTWRVEQILWNRLARLGVEVETGRRLVHLEQTEDTVTAWVNEAAAQTDGWGRSEHHGSIPDAIGRDAIVEGQTETIRVHYVVGCDGGHSTVRNLIGVRYETRRDDFDFVGMVADVQAEGIEPTFARMWIASSGKEVFLSPMPITGNFQLVARLERRSDGSYPEPDIALAQEIIDERAAMAGIRLRHLSWSTIFKVRESLVDRFRIDRVFIAGDAAHLHSPTGGQGANSGIQDAYNLGWKLAYVVSGKAPEALLDTYELERRSVAEQVLQWTGDEHKALFSQLPPNRPDEAAATTDSDALLAYRMSQLWVSYRDSPLNRGTASDDRPTLGDRAPDGRVINASNGRRMRLFDYFRGDHFTLLLFGGGMADKGRSLVGRYGTSLRCCVLKDVDDPPVSWEGDTLIDPHWRVRTSYRATEQSIVVVRPDGHISFHDTGVADDDLTGYLDSILLRV